MSKNSLTIESNFEGYTEQAEKDFNSAVQSYNDDLRKEIERIEAGSNGIGGQPEVTSNMVADAQLVFKRGPIYKKNNITNGFLHLTFSISLVIFGALISNDLTDSYWKISIAGLLLVIAVITGTNLYSKDR